MNSYIGQIICVGFAFAPYGWHFCDGSILNIAENEALFSLIGTTYGGDGQSTFALPDLRGRTPVGTGQLGTAGSYSLGQNGGAENVTLLVSQYPAHRHPLSATASNGSSNTPARNFLASGQSVYTQNTPQTADALNAMTVTQAPGQGFPHNNLQPYLTCNWIISLYGIYPTQQ